MRPVLENTLLFLKGLALNIQPGPQSTSDASTVGIFRPELWNKALRDLGKTLQAKPLCLHTVISFEI